MKGAPTRRVIYSVTDTAWRGSLNLRFQLSFYARAQSQRRGAVLLPFVSASHIYWAPSKSDASEWVTEVREGCAADRHLLAVLHNNVNTGPMRRRVVP